MFMYANVINIVFTHCSQDHQVNEKAAKFNKIGKYGYLIVVVCFQVIFWIVAFYEFMRSAENYLKRGLSCRLEQGVQMCTRDQQ